MGLKHGPKPKNLTQSETLNSLEIWKCNIQYNLRLNPDFKPYLVEGFSWGKKSRLRPYRDLRDEVVHHPEYEDPVSKATVPAEDEITKSREEKAMEVDMLLDQIANYAECIPRNDIVRDSASLDEVWQKIKLFYNLQMSGSLLNECWNIKRLPDETPQALFARLKQAYDENLLTKRGLAYIDGPLPYDEEMTPTLHCAIILQWLEIMHPKLRNLVTQRFATELRRSTYAALFPEISRSIDSLLLEAEDDGHQASCGAVSSRRSFQPTRGRGFKPDFKKSYGASPKSYSKKQCDYCKVAGRRMYYTHNIEDCLFIKKESEGYKARGIESQEQGDDDEDLENQYAEYYEECESHNTNRITDHVINQVVLSASPVLTLNHENEEVDVVADSGATCSVVGKQKAKELNCKIRPTRQTARMADGKASLNIIGETDLIFHKGKKTYHMTALVASDTDIGILGGIPFMRDNDIAIRPATSEIIIDGKDFIRYDASRRSAPPTVRRITEYSIKSERNQVVLPGESICIKVPQSLRLDDSVAVEPRLDSSHNRARQSDSAIWPPAQVQKVEANTVSLVNSTREPVTIKKHEQICLLHDLIQPDDIEFKPTQSAKVSPVIDSPKLERYSAAVSVDPNSILSSEQSSHFQKLLLEYDEVFDPKISRYNGRSGPCFVEVNMGKVLPPQRKGAVPFYGRTHLDELQNKMDELTAKGVFARPQDLGISVENISPSFLVKKPSNPQQKRLVTDFSSIASYCRPTPSLMPRVDSVLQKIAAWKFIVKTDLTESYYQIPMRKSSQKYCGVVSPFKGLLVYCVGVMGLPGVEVALEELTCLILGDLVQLGVVAKVADDIYIGAETVSELAENLKLVLHRFMENNLRLCARKTVIVPREVNILGWLWSSGKLKASPHRLSALAEYKPPTTVSGMRSFIGAYRFLSRVLKGYANLLAPLEKAISGNKNGKEEIQWSEELVNAFSTAQKALSNNKALTLPTPDDTLWIVTDASVKPGAVGATLYSVQNGEPKLAEFFNAKLPEFQQRWLPCEVEGIAIGSALHHFAPYIIMSKHKPHVLTDSKPCVEAVKKMNKGQFSTSARLSTFLSAVSRYQANVRHLSGQANLPSDFSSRHPVECESKSCQICEFLKEYSESVVLSISATDILQGKVQIPYKNRRAWLDVQRECSDLRKVLAFKKSGTEPSKKTKNMRAVRRYLSANIMIANDGLLVQRRAEPLSPLSDHIVVPQQVLHGVLSALHLNLDHPSAFQLSKVFSRAFFALNLNEAVSVVTRGCHLCESIKDVPKSLIGQSTCDPPSQVGISLAADVLIRSTQKILLLRETTTSFTLAEIVNDETAEVIANSLLRMCCILRPASMKGLTIRVDPASSCRSLFSNVNSVLEKRNIHLELGRALNKNKNPVAEKAVKELSRELLIMVSDTQDVTPTTLSLAVANLNARVRAPGLSSHELWTQRDQMSGEQLPFHDDELINEQHQRRKRNHASSELSKSGGKPMHETPNIGRGSLVYLYTDRSKEHRRPRYLVISVSNGMCKLRRFTKKYFGFRTYDAKLEECFTVPVETVKLPEVDDCIESDTDSDSDSESEESCKPFSTQNKDTRGGLDPDPVVHVQDPQRQDPDEEGTDDMVPQEPPRELVQIEEVEPQAKLKTKSTKIKKRKKADKGKVPETAAKSRPQRVVKVPDKMKDYVLEQDSS